MKSAGQYLLKIAVLIRINNALNQIKNENKNIRVCLLLVALIATTKSTSARQEVHSKLSVLQPRHAAQSRNILYKALLWQTMEFVFYVLYNDNTGAYELWKTDGTGVGTFRMSAAKKSKSGKDYFFH